MRPHFPVGFLVFVLGTPCAFAARDFAISRTTGPVTVDGAVDEAAWASALTFDVPYEWNPGDNVPAPVETEVFVTYDERRLYVAWRCHDPMPGDIRAHFMDRDEIDTLVQDDHVVLMVDPFNDGRRGFQFRINPLGVQADAIFSQNEGIEDWSFDLLWQAAGRITAGGYEVEIAIPFAQLRFPAGSDPQTWLFDVGRSYPRNVRHRLTAAPRDRDNSCLLCQVDRIAGFNGLEAGRNLELTPTVTAVRTDARQGGPTGPFRAGDEDTEAGLSLRWGVTSNLTLSAAANPDFSQVEADAAQLDVNERFALFFPEQRPFFLEGADYFSTPISAVFTRTVVDPDWGLKLTGKQGVHAVGVIATRDASNQFLIPSNEASRAVSLAGESVVASVLRYRRDLGRGSSVGVLYAGREGQDDYFNRVAGADLFLRFGPVDTLSAQYLRSETRYGEDLATRFRQPLGEFDDDAFRVQFTHSSRNTFFSASHNDLGKDFRADSGFLPRVDHRQQQVTLGRNIYREGAKIHRVNLTLRGGRIENQAGRRSDSNLRFDLALFGPLQSNVFVTVEERDERFAGVMFEGLRRGLLSSEFQPSGALRAGLNLSAGDALDFANGQVGESLRVSPYLEWKAGRHVNTQFNHTFDRLDVPGGELFHAHLTELRVVYNINVRSFLRLVVQRLDLVRDPSLYRSPVPAKSEDLFTQWLFSYKLSAQTVLFLGYSDTALGSESLDLTTTSRTYFLKVGYDFGL
ncbi:MAG: DUF5916 domain-containing protein [Thermoanaerobaculia bacterium]|nr:DUF5916 domain-containing protein [Thermoanaerobaculia bacterium]